MAKTKDAPKPSHSKSTTADSVVKMSLRGMTVTDIAKSLGISRMRIYVIIRGLRKKGEWPLKKDGTKKPQAGVKSGLMGFVCPGGPSKVQIRGVSSISKVIESLQRVLNKEGDLPCLVRDPLGVYSELAPLLVKEMDRWDVLGSPTLPPGINSGTCVVVWEQLK